jgi:hypothetical protein
MANYMSEETVIVTQVGFIEVTVEMEVSTSGMNIPYSPTVTIEAQGRPTSLGIPAGSKYLIPVTPGKVKVFATFGQVTTEKREVDIQAGVITRIIFRFGK